MLLVLMNNKDGIENGEVVKSWKTLGLTRHIKSYKSFSKTLERLSYLIMTMMVI